MGSSSSLHLLNCILKGGESDALDRFFSTPDRQGMEILAMDYRWILVQVFPIKIFDLERSMNLQHSDVFHADKIS
ncbi:hypothetical protein V6N12_037867 [Hibiscus sabdariffa]|uniref:Uncharacterized protein n=1 Tax=Hibiscus sabdariffa TaxID=183260 RepID=A0ABR1ZSF0_9ROSI